MHTEKKVHKQDPVISGVYGGGPIYKNGATAIPNLKNSGFSEVIVWNISIDNSGDLNFNQEFPLVANGVYIGDATYADFRAAMASLKAAPSRITRLTFSVGSSNFGVFQTIMALINAQGTGPDSILYKNFQALKTAFPCVDAIDFDDENCYDADSMTRFAVMLGDLGFEVSLCPYQINDFWTAVAASINTQRPGTVTVVHLQCYAGGAGQSPCSGWNFGSVPVYPGLADESCSPDQVGSAMSAWSQSCGISGGFIWLYDHFCDDLALAQLYAGAINQMQLR
ncbi:hypothetical protein RugamoR64_38570 [Duganella rhizosphaerae]|uniref:hypothetical protein n=1 Tax=Duganella rhizosphaerae TaxID=2885763 RepID=UPI0030E9D4BE